MAVLSNLKYEHMAQLLAKGETPALAYAAITPRAKNPERNCGRYLRMHPEISVRATEIAQSEVVGGKLVMSKAQEAAAIDKAWVLKNLKEIVERCMQTHPVLDLDGEQVYIETPTGKVAPEFGFDPKAATAALKLLGLEIGMFVQRHAVIPDIFASLPAPVIRQIMEALVANSGRLIEHAHAHAHAHATAAPKLDQHTNA